MAKLTNQQRKENKRQSILENAKRVFQRKGFLDVTMADIITETQISRGGIYLYFKSVDEIFIEVLKQRNSHSLDNINDEVEHNTPFEDVFNEYLQNQKDRLLNHIEDSLLRAVYEFYFTHKSPTSRQFQQEQFAMIKQTILTMLKLGVSQSKLDDQQLIPLSEQLMFLIEGLSVLSLTGGLTEQQVDQQFALINQRIPRV
ncbi:TetR/AcrR family transcriptional regulator [Paucilactobacillus suebicus]|nr:TetR/AcrR family transcriptional regulator [Paucilactobacillus suebicus]